MPKTFDLIHLAIAAGVAIGLAGYVYLTLHDLAGAVLFAFGLLTIVSYRLKLFTSVAGFIHRNEFPQLALILVCNINRMWTCCPTLSSCSSPPLSNSRICNRRATC